jgi:hypothetical protein
MKIAQVLKSTKYFELVGGLNPDTVRTSAAHSKDAVILSRCANFRPATGLFEFTARSRSSQHAHLLVIAPAPAADYQMRNFDRQS